MEQYSQPTLTADYARRGKLFDLGRKLFIIFIPLAVALSAIDFTCFLFEIEAWEELWMNNGNLKAIFIYHLPVILQIIPGVILTFSDKRFRLFGAFWTIALIIMALPVFIDFSDIIGYLRFPMTNLFAMLSFMSLYYVFSDISINKRLALILFFSTIILGSSFVCAELRYLNNTLYGVLSSGTYVNQGNRI